MANTHTTPFVKRMRTQGGTIYTFSSATEDIGLNINERNNIVKMSHYALLNIPSIDATDVSIQNRFNALAIPGALQSFLNSGSVKDGRVVIAESFQNYALNFESHLLDASTYNAELPTTVSERVFWKWLKETGAIRWTDSSVANGINYWKEEIDTDTSSGYNSIVKAIGEISAGATRNGTFGTYNETYILVPTSFGQTNVYFKQIEDDNYKHGMKFPTTGSGNTRILGRENYMKPHPDGLDMNAYYDMADSSSVIGSYNLTYWDGNSMEPGWWYTEEGINPPARTYCTDISTKYTFGQPTTYNNYLIYNGTSDIEFFRSRVDCLSIELDLNNLKTLYSDSALTFDKMAIPGVDNNYDFNAVLLYYTVKNKTNDTVLATNLLGVLFLDPPSGNTTGYPSTSSIVLPSITKLQSGPTGFGTSYSFRLNIKSDYMLDDTLSIVTDTTASQVVLEDFSEVFDGLSKSLQILNQHSGTITYITEQYLDLSSSQTNIANNIADLQYQVNDLSRDIVGTENTIPMFIAGEDPLGDSSIFMYQGKIGFFNNKPTYPVEFDSSVKTKDIYLEYAIRDLSNNVLLSYGSPLQLGSSTNYRDFTVYTGNAAAAITIDVSNRVRINNFLIGDGQPYVALSVPNRGFPIIDTQLGTGLTWSAGKIYVAVNDVSGGVSSAYVDGSLYIRDVSINSIDASTKYWRAYVDGSFAAYNASTNNAFTTLKNYTDGSLALKANYTYVDGSISTSISILNASINTALYQYIKNASLSNDFLWNGGMLEVSIGSLSPEIFVKKSGDTMSGTLFNSNTGTSIDVSGDIKVDGVLWTTNTSANIKIGYDALRNVSVGDEWTGVDNIAIGKNALKSNIIGSGNIALSSYALENTTGSFNVGIGNYALQSNVNATGNIAIGFYSLQANIDGSFNTAVGSSTLSSNIHGFSNVAVGLASLYANTDGFKNVGIGDYALGKNTTGNYNTAVGYLALYRNLTGQHNTAIGYNAGMLLASAAYNASSGYSVFIGRDTKALAEGDQNEVVIGYNAVGGGSNTVTLGSTACTSTYLAGNIVLSNKIISGVRTPVDSSDAVNKWYLDNGAFVNKTGDTMSGALTVNASIIYRFLAPYDDASRNTFIGINAGASTNSTADNTAIGYGALRYNQSHSNTAFGMNALALNQNGYQNTAIGISALQSGIQGQLNVAIGAQSLYVNTGHQNVAIGSGTLYYKVVGDSNVAIGYGTGNLRKGGLDLSTATRSIYIGSGARGGNGTNTNEIVIGTDASSMGNNTTVIGNTGCVSTYLNGALYLNNSRVLAKTFQNLTISTSTYTWYMENGYNAKLTLTTNASINIPDVANGDSGTLIIIQDAIGSRTLDLPVGSLKNSAWTLDTSGRDIISFLYDGSNYYWNKGGTYA